MFLFIFSNSRGTRSNVFKFWSKLFAKCAHIQPHIEELMFARARNLFKMPGTSGFSADFQIRNKSHLLSTHNILMHPYEFVHFFYPSSSVLSSSWSSPSPSPPLSVLSSSRPRNHFNQASSRDVIILLIHKKKRSEFHPAINNTSTYTTDIYYTIYCGSFFTTLNIYNMQFRAAPNHNLLRQFNVRRIEKTLLSWHILWKCDQLIKHLLMMNFITYDISRFHFSLSLSLFHIFSTRKWCC